MFEVTGLSPKFLAELSEMLQKTNFPLVGMFIDTLTLERADSGPQAVTH